MNPATSAKIYWLILKTFANERKIPIIPSSMIDDDSISDFQAKVCHFINFFSQ